MQPELQARVPPSSVLFFDVDEVAVDFLGALDGVT
jgi:hypothetical protein